MKTNKYLSNIQVKMPGIYGGMGPMSHIMFEEALIAECKKRNINNDQDYPVWVVASGSSTPDRTKSIEGGDNSLKHMIHFSQKLESAGADFVVMICNTAHYYLHQVQQNLNIPVISMITQTVNHIKKTYPKITKVGLLATDGTISTKIYEVELSASGFETICFTPNSTNQERVMEAIYNKDFGVKATGNKLDNRAVDILTNCVRKMINDGCEVIIAGCTEISIALKKERFSVDVIDPLELLAEKVIDLSLGTERSEVETTNQKVRAVKPEFPIYNFPNNREYEDFLEF